MEVLAMIVEYNPFHLGHKYHLEHSKSITNADYTIALMSGSFVQRGEPSLIDKWTKSKMAIDNGVDLVIELPFIFATQSAELFAFGGVSLLNNLGIVNYISFGSELGDLNILKEIANILLKEPTIYKESLKEYLSLGYSYAVSRSKALVNYYAKFQKATDTKKIEEILKMSNNILAIEYLKALQLLNSSIKPVTLKRVGNAYNEEILDNKIPSATAIRKAAFSCSMDSIKSYLPSPSYNHLVNYINNYNNFNALNNYSQIIHYLLGFHGEEALKEIMDVEIGLENRIVNKSYKYRNIKDLVEEISTKRYAKTRIQRILVHLMTGLDKNTFKILASQYPTYIRVLAANSKGLFLLRKIKEKSNIPIITKFSHYKKYNNSYLDKIISFDKKSTDLYFMGIDNFSMNMDYYTSPYIKN